MADLSLTDRLFDDADRAPLDPFELFEEWLAAAKASEINDPNAMAVATVDASGMPDVRMVLLNARDRRGFCFFTNYESAKGRELIAHPKAALLFHWKSLRRQIRIRGPVEQVTAAESDAYFATRARQSQLGARVSRQSRPLESRAALVSAVEALDQEIGAGTVTRPPHWSGFRVIPESFEFWKDGAFRLHDRVVFASQGEGWSRQRLYP